MISEKGQNNTPYVIDNEKTWEMYDKFIEDFNRKKITFPPFNEQVLSIMDNTKVKYIDKKQNEKIGKLTNERLSEKSGLPERIITCFRTGKIKNNKGETLDYNPNYRDIVAFCIGCDLEFSTTMPLFHSAGLNLSRTSLLHQAYCYIMINCRGKEIKECNRVLRELKIEKKDELLREKKH